MNIATILDHAVERWPDRTAVVYGSRAVSYADLSARVRRVTGGLRERGIRKGDRLVMFFPNRPEFFELFFAATRLGAIPVPVNPRLHPRELAYIVSHCDARCVALTETALMAIHESDVSIGVNRWFTLEEAGEDRDLFEDEAEPYRTLAEAEPSSHCEVADDHDTCWIFYTSGTTGRPKGACITTGNLSFMIDQYFHRIYSPAGDKTALHIGPLTHGSGLWSMPLIKGGATHVIMEGSSFDPVEALRLVEQHAVDKIVFVSPTVLGMVTDAAERRGYDTSSLELVGYGGSPIRREVLKRAITRFGSIFCQIYGQGECPMTISTLLPSDHDYKEGTPSDERLSSAGRPVLGNEVRALDDHGNVLEPHKVGEIAVRGAGVMSGYWADRKSTQSVFRNGWYLTGDLGVIDEDGYVVLRDRAKELIISGGSNIYPREVEEVLVEHSDVEEVAVFGVPDEFWGESVVAVIAHGDRRQPSEADLLELCKSNLASYKKPRYFRFVSEIPKDNLGKVSKRRLKEQFGAEFDETHSAKS